MRKIESYAELNALIMKQFRRGMVTNSFLSREEYETEIAHGTLGCYNKENGLLIFRFRDTHAILNFWLNGGFSCEDLQFPQNTVLETAHRECDTALIDCIENWKMLGFAHEFSRKRMVNSEIFAYNENTHIRTAREDDLDGVRSLLCENFSQLTGCLPTEEALKKDISAGAMLLYEMNRSPLGLLHFISSKNKTELRHLCVSETARGQGIGGALVLEFGRITNGMTRHVWVRTDNSPAVKLYENCGYKADGMTSDVLIRR